MERTGIAKVWPASTILGVFLLFATACGGAEPASITLSMEQELLDEADFMEILVLSEDARCTYVQNHPETARSAPLCSTEESGTCRTQYVTLNREQLLREQATIFVDPGRWVVLVLLFDSSGIIGRGCEGAVEVESGSLTRVAIEVR